MTSLTLAMRISALTGYALSVSYDFVRRNRRGAERLLAFADGPRQPTHGEAYRRLFGGGS